MAEDRANNPARRPNTPGMGDVWRAVSRGHITNEEGSALNSKWTNEKDYLARKAQGGINSSKAAMGNNNRWKNKDKFNTKMGY